MQESVSETGKEGRVFRGFQHDEQTISTHGV